MFCCKSQNEIQEALKLDNDELIAENEKLKEIVDQLQKKSEESSHDELITENENLKMQIEDLKSNSNEWAENIDEFVDQWYETNKENIDIGIIDLKFFKIDLFPDYLEKHIYKKVLKILFSFMKGALTAKKN
tara:strand:- start:1941 stop:2336 length:396 start_codon:yes stop_codon:yes gene_type:complete